MHVIVHGHGIDVTGPLREYAERKVSKLDEYYGNIQKATVTLDVRPIDDLFRNNVAEVTVWTAGRMLRATDGASDMYAAIDQVFEMLERQIEKHKEKRKHETRRQAERAKEEVREMLEEKLRPKEPAGPVIVKVKRFAMKPQTPEEAAHEMELLGHDFYMFMNSKTREINVVYRRKTGNYGLIEPELYYFLAEKGR